ncbi:hypothetical protein [Phyllobacterium zundukense]|uniref:hypothetical protein n=1 Tax=Phyllobacterium zundukense TaxID=1867719 RepID=UPI00138FE1B9|nr:hypothetical protein [Phyllobacterium zundukense]
MLEQDVASSRMSPILGMGSKKGFGSGSCEPSDCLIDAQRFFEFGFLVTEMRAHDVTPEKLASSPCSNAGFNPSASAPAPNARNCRRLAFQEIDVRVSFVMSNIQKKEQEGNSYRLVVQPRSPGQR